jgi:hypothetical protein
MKYLILIFATLLTVACGGAKQEYGYAQDQQDTLQTIEHSIRELNLAIGIELGTS